jgi:hypothetical protein
MAAFTGVDADLIEVMAGVTYSIGGIGNYLDISADKVSVRSAAGTTYYKEIAAGVLTDWVVLDSTSSNPLGHDCFHFTGSLITHLDVLRGQGTLESGATVSEFCVDGNEGKLVIDAGATSVPLGFLAAGSVIASTVVPTVSISGGSWTQLLGVPTTIEQSGGRSIWKTAGTITTVKAYANAVLDFTQADGVTNITTLYKHPTARVLGWNPENNGMVVVAAGGLRVLSGDSY